MQIILNSLYLNNGTYKHDEMLPCFSCLLGHTLASEMTFIVFGGVLNSTHSLTMTQSGNEMGLFYSL